MKPFSFQRFVSALCLTAGSAAFALTLGCSQTSNPSGGPATESVSSTSDFNETKTSASQLVTESEPASANAGSSPRDAAIRDESPAAGLGIDSSSTPSGRTAPTPEERSPEFTPRNNRQSGLLTAGSFDDVRNFGEFTDAVSRASHISCLAQLPLNSQTHQTVIAVCDGQGRPLKDVRCVVTENQEPQSNVESTALVDLRTGSDGRTTLLTSRSRSQQCRFRVRLYSGNNAEPVVDEVRDTADEWQFTVNQLESTLPTQLDLAIVIDTTGSMQDELDYLKAEIDSISKSVAQLFPNVEQRYALVTYRDQGDEYVCRAHDFSASLTDFRKHLDSESAGGGGDFPEAVDVALAAAADLNWQTNNTARVMFLIGDAPPHADRTPDAIKAVEDLRKQGVRVFPVGASGMDKAAEIILRTASVMTLGEYLFLTDHSGVGNPHAKPDVSQFAVERLDRLMIRMIASELAGKRLVPQEIIAIEKGECTWEQLHSQQPLRPVIGHPQTQTQIQTIKPQVPSVIIVQPSSQCTTLDLVKDSCFAALVWFQGHIGSVLIALISCVLAFDELNRRSSKSRNHKE